MLENVKQFIQAGGNPQEIVELLSDSYRGTVQMSNLLIDWLLVLGDSALLTITFHTHTTSVRLGVSEDDAAMIVAEHLQDAVRQHFDPRRADTVFANLSAAPIWLDDMIHEPYWRGLLYKLADVHKNCSLLDYAIKVHRYCALHTLTASAFSPSRRQGTKTRSQTQLLQPLIYRCFEEFWKVRCFRCSKWGLIRPRENWTI